MIKKYLTEVMFKDGTSEFKSFRNYTRRINLGAEDNGVSVKSIKLQASEIDFDTISVGISNRYEVPVYFKTVNGGLQDEIEVYLGGSNLFFEADTLEINFVALNTAVSDLYSVDYENGVLYLASESNIDLEVSYRFYNTLLKGRRASQLDDEDYKTDSVTISIDNYRADSNYRLVFSSEQITSKEYTTPIIKGLKLNYINTSEEETF